MKESTIAQIAYQKSAIWIQNCDDGSWASNGSYSLSSSLKNKSCVKEVAGGCVPACAAFNRWRCLIDILVWFSTIQRPVFGVRFFLLHSVGFCLCPVLPRAILIELLNLLLAITHELIGESLTWEAHVHPSWDTVRNAKTTLRDEIGIFVAHLSFAYCVCGRNYGKFSFFARVVMGTIGSRAPFLTVLMIGFI